MSDLQDTVVAITGASAGIGRATARELAGAGARVVVGARRKERLAALEAEFPGQIVAVEMDVRSPADAKRLVATAVERFGKLDTLVANAGIGMYGGILDNTDEDLATMLDTNIAGTVWPIRAAVPEMRKAGQGDIVIVASVAGFRGGGDEAVYAATKFAQVGLAGGLVASCAPTASASRRWSGGHLDRVRDRRGPDRGHARAPDVPQARGHRVRDPHGPRAAAPPADPVLDDLEHGPGQLIGFAARFSRLTDPAGPVGQTIADTTAAAPMTTRPASHPSRARSWIDSIRDSMARRDRPATTVPPAQGIATVATRTPDRIYQVTVSRPVSFTISSTPDGRAGGRPSSVPIRRKDAAVRAIDHDEGRETGVDGDGAGGDDGGRVGSTVERGHGILGELLRNVVGADPKVLLDGEEGDPRRDRQGRGGREEEGDRSVDGPHLHGPPTARSRSMWCWR